jgi:ribosomal protein L23
MKVAKPIVTEASYSMYNKGVYVFEVPLEMNKLQISELLEKQFSKEVREIRTSIRSGKTKRVGRRFQKAKMPNIKRAYVKFKGDDKLNFFEE